MLRCFTTLRGIHARSFKLIVYCVISRANKTGHADVTFLRAVGFKATLTVRYDDACQVKGSYGVCMGGADVV